MPELPEVETTVNDLRPQLVGRKIKGVKILKSGSVAQPSEAAFVRGLKDRKIVSAGRRGKYLVFKLDNGRFLIVHLRMTGSLIVLPAAQEPEKYVRIMVELEGGKNLHFRDLRRFGRMWLVADEGSVVGELGIDPFDPDFTLDCFANLLKSRSTAIKPLLMNQALIAGVGNMYADEALYLARIHPLQPAKTLTRKEAQKLYEAVREVLRQGIKNKGASTDTYLRPDGGKGQAHLAFQVAHQKGKSCGECGGRVERIVVGQRGTFFCPKCQKLHK